MQFSECFQNLFQLLEMLTTSFSDFPSEESLDEDSMYQQMLHQDLFVSLTVLYFMLQMLDDENFRNALAAQEPNMVSYFIKQISCFRLNIPDDLPWRNIFLLTWKLILKIFGNSNDLAAAKRHARAQSGLPPESPTKDPVSASPIDYQSFRQSISSRYPGYKPETANALPREFAMYVNPSAASSSSSIASLASEFEYSADPLPESSVHIATPAPSPPPSPPPTSTKTKKSAFQTDRSFPFLYPQQESESATSTMPTSIQEAEEIFAQRLRTSLGIVQLWREREEFMKQERGWINADPVPSSTSEKFTADFDEISQTRLDRVEDVYVCLPDLFQIQIQLILTKYSERYCRICSRPW